MDGVQKILLVIIVSLAFLLVIVGVEVILILRDLKRALRRLNNMLDDSVLGGGLIQPDKLTSIFELFGKKFIKRGYGEGVDKKGFPLEAD
jgi:hypothetical protein